MSIDLAGLRERARIAHGSDGFSVTCEEGEALIEAAEELQAIKGPLVLSEMPKTERQQLKATIDQLREVLRDVRSENFGQMQAEIERLREALRQIEQKCRFSYAHASTADDCMKIARAALERSK